MTRWFDGDVAAAVNCYAATDVIGIINRSKRTSFPANTFAIDEKAAPRCVGYAGLAFVNKRPAGTGRHRENSNSTFVVDQQQHLTIQIHFNMFVSKFSGFGCGTGPNCLQLIEPKFAGHSTTFPFLKSDQG